MAIPFAYPGSRYDATDERDPNLHREMRMQLLTNVLWAALFAAQELGLDDVVDEVGRLHQQIVRRLQHLREAV